MRDTEGAQTRSSRPGTVQSEIRPGVDMRQISSSDFTALEGQGGASEYYLNNINLDETTSADLYAMVNNIVDTLRRTTPLLDRKRITKMYAVELSDSVRREAGEASISPEDVFYRHMTSDPPVVLRTLVSRNIGERPLVILVELNLEPSGGLRRKSRRRRKSNRKSRRR